MGVFGSSDGDQSKRLAADIAFIKTRLDLIAKQLSSGQAGGSDPQLDAKLHAIYRAISNVQAQQHAHHESQPPAHQHVPASDQPVSIEGLDELRADVRQLLSKSDRALHLDLTQRLDSIEKRLDDQQSTIRDLTDALRSLVQELGNR